MISTDCLDRTAGHVFLLRLRPDLIIHCQQSNSRKVWIVKDPVSLRYYRFREEEYTILRMLDGRHDLEEMRSRFEEAFPPHRMTTTRLQGFLATLHRSGLLLSDGPNQGTQLLVRHDDHQRKQWYQSLSNVLAIRFQGVDPERFLTWLYPKLRWCFGAPFLSACLLLILSALALVLVEADEFRTRLPDLTAFVNAGNLPWLVGVLAVTKILHEMGHALTCKHYGGECHEMGVMLLVFSPCLYCNVTDTWTLRNRWHRIAVTGAGIGVEVVLASIATFGWWFSQPGLFHTVCLNTMVICGLGTLVLNGNPLLRYDGYFILSDLLETPNLWQESRAVVHRFLARWLLGIELDVRAISPERSGLLALYGIASMVYRCMVVVVILHFLYRILAPMRLELLAHLVTASMVLGIVAASTSKARRMMTDPLFSRRIKFGRLAATTCVLLAFMAGALLIPLPCRIAAPIVLEPYAAERVYVKAAGTIVASVTVGDHVQEGERVAQLEDFELRGEVIRLRGAYKTTRIRVKSLESQLSDDSVTEAQLVVAREQLADVRQQLDQRQRELESLTLRAPISGVVIPPPGLPPHRGKVRQLPRWTGTPLDEQNLGCMLERGTVCCLIGNPARHEAKLFVDEMDIPYVARGQRVRISLNIAPGVILTGTVQEISGRDVQIVPRELAAGQEVASQIDMSGTPRPLRTSYQVRVTFDEHPQLLVVGARGRAKIHVAPQTLSRRIYRLLRRTFAL